MTEQNEVREADLQEAINKATEEGDLEKAEQLKHISKSLDELEDGMIEMIRKSQNSWTKGFLSGYGAAIGGVVLGVVAIKAIDKFANRG